MRFQIFIKLTQGALFQLSQSEKGGIMLQISYAVKSETFLSLVGL